VGAQVCLETANIEPSAGLFVSAIGRVVEIVYDKTVGPNSERIDHLPKYVVVDIPMFKPPEGVPVWDKNNPTVSSLIRTLHVLRFYQNFRLTLVHISLPWPRLHILLSMFPSLHLLSDAIGAAVPQHLCR